MPRINRLLREFNGRCVYCAREVFVVGLEHPNHATVDHDVPKSRGGDKRLQNGVLSCLRCNQAKGDMTGEEFRWFLQYWTLAPTYIEYLSVRAKKVFDGHGAVVIHSTMKRPVKYSTAKPRMIEH